MKKKILLVEDEVILAMAKQQELAGYNYETAHVTTGEKAVELVCSQNEEIDLILMDIDLGRGIDGTEAARQILDYKEIPIVFLSSHEEPEIVEKTEKITSYGYVVKSSSITVIDASIKMAFKLYHSQFKVEHELQEKKILEEKYRNIFENAVLGIFRSTPEGKYEIVNKAFARILGFASPQKVLNEVTDISKLYKYPKDREKIKNEFAEKGFVEDYEILANHPVNDVAWISITARQSQYPDGSIYYEGTVQDITERKHAEEELRKALKEKDYLMKELNHRVKNSLLMVSSLINLKDSETEIDLSHIQHQIEAISLIHEKLYKSESVVEINSKDYFDDLLNSILSSFSKRGVRIDKCIEDISLPTETTMTLGLIINEIVTNAIKHGFTDNEESVFSIKLEKDIKKSQYVLTLSNTGNPFPEEVDIESTKTLGLRLINALVAQLDGTVALQRKSNPTFTIKIPIED